MSGRPAGTAVLAQEARGTEDGSRHKVEVRRADVKGQGIFAVETIARGEVAVVGRPVAELTERNWKSLQVSVDRHIEIDAPFEFTNHSCNPSCGIRANEHGAYDLVALRDLGIGAEITFDYCMTEWECVGFTDCNCGSGRCRGTVQGAGTLPQQKLEEYEGHIAPYLESLLYAAADPS